MTLTLVLPFDRPDYALPTTCTAPPPSPWSASAARRPVLGLLDNGKIKAGALLTAIGEALLRRNVVSEYFLHAKSAMVPIDEAQRDAICARAEIVIAGLGDCGGCTACSVTDAVRCLERGLPSFILATGPFSFLVDATAREYRADGLQRLLVEHPVWSRDVDWISAAGEALADQVQAVIGSGPSSVVASPEPFAAVNLALQPLREAMDADGYDLTIVDDGEMVAVAVLAREGVCGTCLIPQSSFARLVADALNAGGREIDAARITVTYSS